MGTSVLRLHCHDRNSDLTSPHRQRRKPASIRRSQPIKTIILSRKLGSHSIKKPPDALMTEFAASRYGDFLHATSLASP